MKLLVKNELRKIFKQVAFKIILIIFACLIFLSPIVTILISKLFNLLDFSGSGSEYYIEIASDYAYDEDLGSKSGWAYYMGLYYTELFFENENIKTSSAEYSIYKDDVAELKISEIVIKMILSDVHPSASSAFSYGWAFDDKMCGAYEQIYGTDPVTEYLNAHPDITEEEYYELNTDYAIYDLIFTDDVMNDMVSKIDYTLNVIKTKVLSFDIKSYYKISYNDAVEELGNMKNKLAEAKSELAAAQGKDKETAQYVVDSCEAQIKGQEYALTGFKYLYDNGCEFNGSEYKTVIGILASMPQYMAGYIPLTEDDYYEDPNYSGIFAESTMSYEDYVKTCKNNYNDAVEASEIAVYSLEHNTPIPESMEFSAKKSWQNSISSLASTTAIVMIVIAGTTIATEYSSGSIRLLLIRPCSRRKILMSKVLAILIVWGTCVIASYVSSFLVNLIFYGPSDLFAADLFYVNGRVIAIPSILNSLIYALEDMLAQSVNVSFALLLSIVIRKAVLAIALPILGQSIVSIVQYASVILSLYTGKWIVYTPFPYFELIAYRQNASSMFLTSEDLYSLATTQAYPYSYIRDFNVLIGIAWLAVITGTWIFLSFRAFKKQQITN